MKKHNFILRISAMAVLLLVLFSCKKKDFDPQLHAFYISQSRDKALEGTWRLAEFSISAGEMMKKDPSESYYCKFYPDGYLQGFRHPVFDGNGKIQRFKQKPSGRGAPYYTKDSVLYILGIPSSKGSPQEKKHRYRIVKNKMYEWVGLEPKGYYAVYEKVDY